MTNCDSLLFWSGASFPETPKSAITLCDMTAAAAAAVEKQGRRRTMQ
jgi:hypothetical protein